MLEISDMVAGYRGRAVARLPRLNVAAGEAVLLAGRSGLGKTTLLLAIAGLADCLSGTVRFDAVDIGALGGRARDQLRGRTIAFVFQDLHLIPGLSALDNMLLAPFASRTAPDRAAASALLDRLGVGHRAHAAAEKLSRGEAQRVAIARAMLMRPKLILADEPTASLDDDAAVNVIELLRDAARIANAALVIASHDGRVRDRLDFVVQAEAA